MTASYTLYILECCNGALYTGYTTDLDRRFKEHLAGNAKCKFTRAFPPKHIAASWTFETDLSTILKLEKRIKKLSRAKKLRLIANKDWGELIENLDGWGCLPQGN